MEDLQSTAGSTTSFGTRVEPATGLQWVTPRVGKWSHRLSSTHTREPSHGAGRRVWYAPCATRRWRLPADLQRHHQSAQGIFATSVPKKARAYAQRWNENFHLYLLAERTLPTLDTFS